MPLQVVFSLQQECVRRVVTLGESTLNALLRKTVLQIHRWTGLTFGLVMAFVAITGLGMVFRPQLQPIVERDLAQIAPCRDRLPLDALVSAARDFYPDAAIVRIELPRGVAGATVVRFADKQGVYVNPCTAEVLGQHPLGRGLFATLEQWHRLHFIDNTDITELVTGSLSLLVALLMVGGGLLIAWPPTLRALLSTFKFRTRLVGRAFDLNLHRTTGFYVGLILLMSAVTSLTFTFDWARRAVFAAVGSPLPLPKPSVGLTEAPMQPAETFLRRALTVAPDAREITLTYPRKSRDAIEVLILERDAPHPYARTYLYIDPYTSDVLRFEPYARSSTGNKVYRWLGSLHTGNTGGVVVQLALFAGILGIPILAFTGIRSYLRRAHPSFPLVDGLRARVTRISVETQDIKTFELKSADAVALPKFTPGAHIAVCVDEGLIRPYSLCNNASDRNRYLIAVKREPDPAVARAQCTNASSRETCLRSAHRATTSPWTRSRSTICCWLAASASPRCSRWLVTCRRLAAPLSCNTSLARSAIRPSMPCFPPPNSAARCPFTTPSKSARYASTSTGFSGADRREDIFTFAVLDPSSIKSRT